MIAEELPTDIVDKYKMLNTALGLHFSGIDLMLTPDNKWYCFEVNTSPAIHIFN
jgi:D-alanine-D-alanine ligase-like ATP-grasp enzyme